MIKVYTNDLREAAKELKAGDEILLSGSLYTARDAAHKRIYAAIKEGKPLPFPLRGAVIYYAGPTAAPIGLPTGAIGPTTSARMDSFAPELYDMGVAATIGKGQRSKDVKDAIIRNKALYLAALGGAGALAAKAVKSLDVIAYEELSAESVKLLTVKDFPLFVALDIFGGDIYER